MVSDGIKWQCVFSFLAPKKKIMWFPLVQIAFRPRKKKKLEKIKPYSFKEVNWLEWRNRGCSRKMLLEQPLNPLCAGWEWSKQLLSSQPHLRYLAMTLLLELLLLLGNDRRELRSVVPRLVQFPLSLPAGYSAVWVLGKNCWDTTVMMS